MGCLRSGRGESCLTSVWTGTLDMVVPSSTYGHMSCKLYRRVLPHCYGVAPLATSKTRGSLKRLVLLLYTCKPARTLARVITLHPEPRLIASPCSPAVVGNLWDVTDKDLDRFTHSALEKFGLLGGESNGVLSLPSAVAASRSSCSLRYLNGAAPVVWGIPVKIAERATPAPS